MGFGIVIPLGKGIRTDFVGMFKNKIPIYKIIKGKIEIYVTVVKYGDVPMVVADTDFNSLIRRLENYLNNEVIELP